MHCTERVRQIGFHSGKFSLSSALWGLSRLRFRRFNGSLSIRHHPLSSQCSVCWKTQMTKSQAHLSHWAHGQLYVLDIQATSCVGCWHDCQPVQTKLSIDYGFPLSRTFGPPRCHCWWRSKLLQEPSSKLRCQPTSQYQPMLWRPHKNTAM